MRKSLITRIMKKITPIERDFMMVLFRRLLSPPSEPERSKKRIGFVVEESHVPYKSSKRSRVDKGHLGGRHGQEDQKRP